MARLFLILIFCVVTSCSRRVYQDHQVKTASLKSNKAVVVLKVTGESSAFFGIQPKVSFDLVKVDEKSGISDEKTFYRVEHGLLSKWGFGSKLEYLMMEPGFYVIDNISWTSGNTTYFTKKDSIHTLFPILHGGFKIHPGSVNYLGDLVFTCDQNNALSIKKFDRFTEALTDLKARYPELSSKLTKTEFFPGGSRPSVTLEMCKEAQAVLLEKLKTLQAKNSK